MSSALATRGSATAADTAGQPRLVAVDPDFVLLAKPAGTSFHAEAGSPGLVDLARDLSGLDELFPVHRLDRITSGLVLLARSADAARAFGERFAAGTMEKYYLALSLRAPAKKQGWVRGAMIKGRSGDWRLAAEGGPLAVTQFFSFGLGDGRRLFVVRPRTGRTHQIRVALKSLGSPILGDTRYGGAESDRGYLHAWSLGFEWRGEARRFSIAPDQGAGFLDAVLAARLAEIGAPGALAWPAWHGKAS